MRAHISFLVALSLMMIIGNGFAQEGDTRPIQTYTQFTSTAEMPPTGKFTASMRPSYGILPWLKVQSDLRSDVNQIYSLTFSGPILREEKFVIVATSQFQSIDGQTFNWILGLSAARAITEGFSVSVGGDDAVPSVKNPIGIPTSGLIHGSDVKLDLAWRDFKSDTGKVYVTTLGVVRNFNQCITGFGFSQYMGRLRVGLEYYPKAMTSKINPMLTFRIW